jgi:hypothetical protein
MTDVVQGANMGMIKPGDDAGLAFETLFQFGRTRKGGIEDLDGNDSIKARISGAIHFAHSACAQR